MCCTRIVAITWDFVDIEQLCCSTKFCQTAPLWMMGEEPCLWPESRQADPGHPATLRRDSEGESSPARMGKMEFTGISFGREFLEQPISSWSRSLKESQCHVKGKARDCVKEGEGQM